jgi:hypothetical protein
MGVTWAIGWAIVGLAIGVTSRLTPFLPWERFFAVFDAPLPALAVPGFVGGTIFSFVLGIAARHRRFDELSVPRFAAWGAVGGLLLGLVPAALTAIGMASGITNVWSLALTIAPPLVVLSAGSAAGTLALARKAQSASVPPLESASTPPRVGP